MQIYCTLIDHRYLQQGLALHRSLEMHCKPYHLHIMAYCGRSLKILRERALPNVTVIPTREVESEALRAIEPRSDPSGYAWAHKPSLMLYVLRDANR